MLEVNRNSYGRRAAMRNAIFAISALGAITLHAMAADYPNYPGYQAPMNGWNTSGAFSYSQFGQCNASYGPMMQNPGYGGYCNRGDCNGSYSSSQGEYKVRKFMDFLCYKPTVPCEFWCRTTCYVPPLYTNFPPCCNATGGDCASCCGGRPHLFRTARSGCGPSCSSGCAPMANGCPAISAPGGMPETGVYSYSAPSQTPNRSTGAIYSQAPMTVAYTKPSTVFVPAAQQSTNQVSGVTQTTFVPFWYAQQLQMRSPSVPAASTVSGLTAPLPQASYYLPPRQ
jgi:hypothetical protein